MVRYLIILLSLLLAFPAHASQWNLIRGRWGDSAGEWDDVRIDASTNTLQTIGYEHHEVHTGNHYICVRFSDIVNNGTSNVIISTNNSTTWTHMLFQATVEAECTLSLFEAVSINNDGTAITAVNSNRNSANVASTLISVDSTIIDEGELLAQIKVGSGKSFGGGIRGTEEIVLKQNTKYIFRISNDAAQTTWVSKQLSWYEHQDEN